MSCAHWPPYPHSPSRVSVKWKIEQHTVLSSLFSAWTINPSLLFELKERWPPNIYIYERWPSKLLLSLCCKLSQRLLITMIWNKFFKVGLPNNNIRANITLLKYFLRKVVLGHLTFFLSEKHDFLNIFGWKFDTILSWYPQAYFKCRT